MKTQLVDQANHRYLLVACLSLDVVPSRLRQIGWGQESGGSAVRPEGQNGTRAQVQPQGPGRKPLLYFVLPARPYSLLSTPGIQGAIRHLCLTGQASAGVKLGWRWLRGKVCQGAGCPQRHELLAPLPSQPPSFFLPSCCFLSEAGFLSSVCCGLGPSQR